jgi:hypothetical protein
MKRLFQIDEIQRDQVGGSIRGVADMGTWYPGVSQPLPQP